MTCWLQVGGNTEGVAAQPDPHSYMQAYKEWRHKKTSGDTQQLGSLQDIKVCEAADTSLKPAADTSLKPAADTSLKPAYDTSLKPAADTSLKPAARPLSNPLLTPLSLSGLDRVSGAGVCDGSTF